jgi:pyruvate/2-oxoglutarate dehydrogenase complex dihydrolipoamide acyltransferase (E2) component
MMLDIMLPALPGGTALVLRWLATPGAALSAGSPLLIIRTDSVEVALPAPEAGELTEILAAVGATVATGQPLARLRTTSQDERVAPLRATPLARRMAEAHGIRLADLTGSGFDGRVVAADVGPKQSPTDTHRAPEILVAPASALVPIATAMIEFDAGAAQGVCRDREAEFGRVGLRASLESCVVIAVAGLLPGHRVLNARWGNDGILLRRRLHLAVARASRSGLRWALVRDAGDLTLRGVARSLLSEVEKDTLAEASFAIVSLADGAAWHSAPPPLEGTLAALGLGAPRRRPVVCGEAIAVRPVAALTMSYDARALDHVQVAAFLCDLRDRLESLGKQKRLSIQAAA